MPVQNSRCLFIVEGILFTLLGLLAIALPVASTIAMELFVGWLLLIGGVFQIYRSFKFLQKTEFYLTLLSGILNIALGILFIAYPSAGLLSLTFLLIFFFLFQGISKIILGIRLRHLTNWFWLIFSGIISIIMAAIIWSGWPATAFWVIGLLVGINMLFFGISLLVLASTFPKSNPNDQNTNYR